MTLDNLFDDLESQLDRELEAQLQNRLDDEERERQCALTLRERIFTLSHHSETRELTMELKDAVTMTLRVQRVGKDWFLAEIVAPENDIGTMLCSLAAIRVLYLPAAHNRASLGETVGELSSADLDSLRKTSGLTSQVTFAFVLRDVGRRRKQVEVVTAHARIRGLINRVAADHIEMSGEPASLMPFTDVLYVRVL